MMNYEKVSKQVFSGNFIGLFSDGSIENLTDYIKVFRIENNLERFIMPVMFLKLDLRPDILIRFQQDDNVLININIYYVQENTSNTSVYDIFVENINYKIIRMDRTPINYSDKLTKENSENYQYEPFECIAVPENYLNLNKTLISGTLNNASVADSLAHLVSKLNYKAFIDQPDNEKTYEQIIYIPGNIFMNINYLDSVYGIYNKGMRLFLTPEKLVISSKERFNSKLGSITLDIKFPVNNDDSIVYDVGCYRDNNDLIINSIIDNVKVTDYEDSFKEIYANNQYYVSRDMYSENIRLNHFDVEQNGKEFNKTKVFFNKYNNEQKENELFDKSKDHKIIQFYFDNLDIKLQDTFKIVNVNFDNEYYKEYNGKYYVMSLGHHFIKKTGIFDMKGIMILKRI